VVFGSSGVVPPPVPESVDMSILMQELIKDSNNAHAVSFLSVFILLIISVLNII
jgi:hypothetical protein